MSGKTISAKAEREVEAFIAWLIAKGVPKALAVDRTRIFAEAIAGRTTTAANQTLAAQVKPLMQQFRQLFLARYHTEPIVDGRDYARLQAILKRVGPQVASARLNLFYEIPDDWLDDHGGRTITAFHRRWNQLAVAAAQRTKISTPTGCDHEPPCRDAIAHNSRFRAEHR